MILGIGIDLLNINRIEKFKNNERFLNRILSVSEKKEYKVLQKNHTKFLAKRFCVKEAFSKAIGTGIGRGINFNDITLEKDILGKPIISLNEKAISSLEELFKINYDKLQIDVSTTDEDNYVNSFVVLSKN